LRRSNLLACEGLPSTGTRTPVSQRYAVFFRISPNAIVLVDGIRHFVSVRAAFMSPYDYFHSTQSPTSFSTTLAPLWLMFSGRCAPPARPARKLSAWPTRLPGWPAAWKRDQARPGAESPPALAPACRAAWMAVSAPGISGRR